MDEKCCFTVNIYDIQPFNDTLSKGRVRIFYTGLNRNRTYITEGVAQELINSLPYTPVKGIYNDETGEFEDHGLNSQEGKIYGIVPADPNFAWEDFEDEDGQTRQYACADVFLFTSLYPEAEKIQGSPQSMEIYDKTMEGHWTDEDIFVFDHGRLLGLQVLGNSVEPCFEGASFFSLSKNVQELITYIQQLGGEKDMEAEKEKICDEVVANDCSFAKKRTKEKVVEEAKAAEESQEQGNAEFSAENEKLKSEIEGLNQEIEEKNQEIESKNQEIETKDQEIETKDQEIEAKSQEIEAKSQEIIDKNKEIERFSKRIEELETFKKNVEREEKQHLLGDFSKHISSEQLANYTASLDDFTIEELKKELCVAAYDSGHLAEQENLVYKLQGADKTAESGVLRLLSNHKKGGEF